MNEERYLLDTHALLFWNTRESVSEEFVRFFDEIAAKGRLYVSSISFWEITLLVKKGRVSLTDVEAWKNELMTNTNLHLSEPSVSEMIQSTLLPDIHKDPFDRLLIAQTNQNGFVLVTRDNAILQYTVETYWV